MPYAAVNDKTQTAKTSSNAGVSSIGVYISLPKKYQVPVKIATTP